MRSSSTRSGSLHGVFRYVAAATLIAAAAGVCSAADFPIKPITLIAPTVPGGAVDGSSRLIADKLSQKLGQRFIVENRPGANGTIGAALVAHAQSDGYTLLFTQNTPLVVAPHSMKSLSYDVFADFIPITEVGKIQLVLVTHPSLKVGSLGEFIAVANSNPGKIQYGSGGEGSDHHLAMELLRISAGIRLNHVPYKAGPQGFADLLGGHISAMFIAPGTAARQVTDGRLIALGVASAKPIESYPGVPPIGRLLPGYEYESWFAVFAPKGTPAAVVAKLNAEFQAAIAIPEVAQKMLAIGIVPNSSSPEEMARLLKTDYQKIGKLLKEIGSQLK